MTAPLLARPADQPDARAVGWPVPANETERVAALHTYHVLDQRPQDDLDAAVRLAAYLCGTPYAVINLIDSDRQWQAAAFGVERGEHPRADAMCSQVVLGTDVVSVADASADDRFARNPFVTGVSGRVRQYASAPLVTREGHPIGTVCAYAETAGELSGVQTGLLADVAAQVMWLFEMRRMAAALSRITSRDVLTGLANRRGVEKGIGAAIARAERGLGSPSVVMIDIDGFAAINDAYGHVVGDAVLCSVAERLTRTARTVDMVARTSGDEFVVLLESTGGPGATAALGRLRQSLAGGWAAITGGPDDEIGASLGITTYRPGDSVASVVSRGDAELYSDKVARRAARHG